MKKEIEQRPEDRLLIGCHCGFNHFLLCNSFEWDDYKEFSVGIVMEPDSFWYRIRKAIKYIIRGGDLYYMDVSINDKDLLKLKTLINKHLSK